jgi:iron complex outermembrane receptor protein
LTGGLRYTDDHKERFGVNARYGFALGGQDFACCGGVRVGTEGFEFAGFDRTIYNPDTDGDGLVTDQEVIDFYFDGVNQFGARDNVDEVFANGPFGGDAPFDSRAECLDTVVGDFWNCAADGRLTYAVPFQGQIALQNGSMDNDFTDWRVRLEYDVTPDHLVYGLIATGNKSGGFNDNVPGTDGIGPINPAGNAPAAFDTQTLAPTYDGEEVTLFEFGTKNEFLWGNTNTRLNASLFYYDYKDLVLGSLVSTAQILDFEGVDTDLLDPALGSQVVFFNFNASDAEIYGAQLEGSFYFQDDWTLNATLLWMAEATVKDSREIQDSRFQADVSPEEAVNRSIEGKRLPRTPEWQLNAALSKSFYLGTGRLDWVTSVGYRDDQFMTIFNGEDYTQPEDPRLRLNDQVESYWTTDMGLAYYHDGGDRFVVEAYASNLTNEQNEQAIIITQFDNTRFFQRPRAYGVRLRMRF